MNVTQKAKSGLHRTLYNLREKTPAFAHVIIYVVVNKRNEI